METNIFQSEVVHVKGDGEPSTSSITRAQRSFLTLKCAVDRRLQLVLTQTGSKQNLGRYVFNDGRGGTPTPKPGPIPKVLHSRLCGQHLSATAETSE